LKIPSNIEKFECMEYTCDKIIPIIKFENLNMHLKIKVGNGKKNWVNFFKVHDIDIH
jgi:hypothetical protein